MRAFLTNIDLMNNDDEGKDLTEEESKDKDDANTTYHALICLEKLLKLDDLKTVVSTIAK